jgi:hypothetical protein
MEDDEMSTNDSGASASGPGSCPSGEAPSGLRPSGFDPSRGTVLSVGWDEHNGQPAFVARVKLDKPPAWPAAVVWEAWPVEIRPASAIEAAKPTRPKGSAEGESAVGEAETPR